MPIFKVISKDILQPADLAACIINGLQVPQFKFAWLLNIVIFSRIHFQCHGSQFGNGKIIYIVGKKKFIAVGGGNAL